MLLGWKRSPIVLRDGRQGCYPTRCLLGNGFLFAQKLGLLFAQKHGVLFAHLSTQKRGFLFAQQRGFLFALLSVRERGFLFAQKSVRGPPHIRH